MMSTDVSPYVNVCQCSQCQGDTEYYCKTCELNLCPPCKRTHTMSLDTNNHDVTLYREKFSAFYINEYCFTHPGQLYKMYCETCTVPVCFHCRKHRHHKLENIETVYKNKRTQSKDILINIRGETLNIVSCLRDGLKSIVSNEITTLKLKKSEILRKLQSLKKIVDVVLSDDCNKKERSRFSIQLIKTIIGDVQYYEHIYEQTAYRSVEFLQFIKKRSLPRMKTTNYIWIEHLNTLLSKIEIIKKGKRCAGNELLLTLMPSPVLQKSFSLTTVYRCLHISCAKPDRVWISEWSKITLIDTTIGEAIHCVCDASCFSGMHTVNKNSELIYIDKDSKIIKLSNDLISTTTLIDNTDPLWKPWCVYCSTLSGDLLVGIRSVHSDTYKYSGTVMRYNCRFKKTQIIPLTEAPKYITENNNSDIVVSAMSTVVVTSRVGIPRFTYTGPHTSKSKQKLFPNNFRPQGICTDALSNILVCDACNLACTVHMLDRDGQFLSYLILTKHFTGINSELRGLSYDKITNRLLVVTDFENILSVYRYIDRHTAVSGKSNFLLIIT